MKKLDTPIQYIKGVGPQKSRVLSRLGIKTVCDMLYYLPFRYEDRSRFASISDLIPGGTVAVKGVVKKVAGLRTKKGVAVFQLALDDSTGVVYGVWFNQPYMNKVFSEGQRVCMYGKVERYDKLQMNHPQYEILKNEDDSGSIHFGRIAPVYHLIQDIGQRYLRAVGYRAVSEYARYAADMLPTRIRARNKLTDINFAIRNIHFPASAENLKRAYTRIVFDEFFTLQLAVAMRRGAARRDREGVGHVIDEGTSKSFVKNLPFELTPGQKDAMISIEKDMASGKPMNRLIQGDVGSGKTVLAAYALLLTVANSNQGVIMAPTEILAEQHYVALSRLLAQYDVNIVLLMQGLSQKARSQTTEDIAAGRADIVIGTHALIQEGVRFKKLGLVVIDEQHKFGVSQRAKLQTGNVAPDTLLMTATPIPRTLALTVYGDLDISVIRELPPDRGEITTYWVSDSQREKIYNFLREEVRKGRQAYVVYPRLEETGKLTMRSAKAMHEELDERIFKDLKVGLIHGKMDQSEKEAAMSAFKKGETDILVSTVVVEVGIDVPNASVMVIENAERFGLSQLHQLRGRIGRASHESYCVLVSDAANENAAARLTAITESTDGFQIAEEDLKLRGPGDIFGTRQHGLPEVRFGNIMRDMEIMDLARREAFELIEKDPDLAGYENRFIKENLEKRFKGNVSLVRVG